MNGGSPVSGGTDLLIGRAAARRLWDKCLLQPKSKPINSKKLFFNLFFYSEARRKRRDV